MHEVRLRHKVHRTRAFERHRNTGPRRKSDLEPISESLPADERRADFLAKIAGDDESIIHIEFQTRYDSTMPVRMLTYYARILGRYGLPVYPVVVYLAKTSVPIETTYNSHVRNKHVIAFNYDVIKVWELKSKMVFKNKLAGLYALAPLMPDADLNECRERMIEAIRENLISSDAYMCMATFASLIHPKEVVNDFFTKNRVKTALREGIGDTPS